MIHDIFQPIESKGFVRVCTQLQNLDQQLFQRPDTHFNFVQRVWNLGGAHGVPRTTITPLANAMQRRSFTAPAQQDGAWSAGFEIVMALLKSVLIFLSRVTV